MTFKDPVWKPQKPPAAHHKDLLDVWCSCFTIKLLPGAFTVEQLHDSLLHWSEVSHHLLSLQLPNQTRVDSGPEVISQSSSLLPIPGFPMQVRALASVLLTSPALLNANTHHHTFLWDSIFAQSLVFKTISLRRMMMLTAWLYFSE